MHAITSTLALALAVASAGGCEGSNKDETAGEPSAAGETSGRETAGAEGTAEPAGDPEQAAAGGGEAQARGAPKQQEPDSRHAAWDAIVSRYVTDDGGFRYAALRDSTGDPAKLDGYLEQIAQTDVSELERDAQLAFYINAYNALTVKAVLDEWPLESVMKVDGFFKKNKHTVAGKEVTLDQLEHEVIREEFDEPRIHFAVNCASVGCPPLAGEAYTADNLERLLAAQTQAYVRHSTEIDDKSGKVRVSKLFEWFEEDFEGAGGVRAFVAAQLPDGQADKVRDEELEIVHLDYDWDLNDRE